MARRDGMPPPAAEPPPAAKVPKPLGSKPAAAPERQIAFRLGLTAESRAAALLIGKGYRILDRRWKCPAGEIDIVARRRDVLIFVEVKARAKIDDAAWSVTPRQQQRIVAAAEIWLARHPEVPFQDIRFDAVLVAPGAMPRHIQMAFRADGA